MDAAPMVYHSWYHQQSLPKSAFCPLCGARAVYEGLWWRCEAGCLLHFQTPIWSVPNDPGCPFPELHVA